MVVVASAATRAVQHATCTIPMVMAGGSDPVRAGLVASLAHPGGNITGFSTLAVELPEKRLELLKELMPPSGRIAVLANPAHPNHAFTVHNLTRAAQALGLHLHVVELRRPDELDAAFAAVTRTGADALLVVGEPLLVDSLRVVCPRIWSTDVDVSCGTSVTQAHPPAPRQPRLPHPGERP
jgi:putative tryptophan/tyrosine transport system substrate-binding protein